MAAGWAAKIRTHHLHWHIDEMIRWFDDDSRLDAWDASPFLFLFPASHLCQLVLLELPWHGFGLHQVSLFVNAELNHGLCYRCECGVSAARCTSKLTGSEGKVVKGQHSPLQLEPVLVRIHYLAFLLLGPHFFIPAARPCSSGMYGWLGVGSWQTLV